MMYKSSELIQPFYPENNGFKTGRDPLGVQSSSIALYARLLPGMTNLTTRIRYYSFYCWLLKEYDNLDIPEVEKTLLHQYTFIRRAELTLAFTMVNLDSSQTGIIGSKYVKNHLEDIKTNGFYNIKEGADKKKADGSVVSSDLYWGQSAGALGQYYSSSLATMGLIETVDQFFHILQPGRKLSSSFEQNVSKEARDKFLSVLKTGKLDSEDIQVFGGFDLKNIPVDSKEWNLLVDMLLQDDGPNFKTVGGELSYKRRDTIFLYLAYLDTGYFDDLKFEELLFNSFEEQSINKEAYFGWCYYYMSEVCHFALETIFWAMLVHLDGKFLPIRTFIEEIEKLILEENCKRLKVSETTNYFDVVLTSSNFSLIEKQWELENLTKSVGNYQIALGKAVEMLSLAYLELEPKLSKIREFEVSNSLQHQQGGVFSILESFVINHEKLTYRDHVQRLIRILINDHISTAYRKMGYSDSNLLKFVVEDNIIGHIETMTPRHTNPRLNTIHQFLLDLGLIDESNKPTALGYDLVKERNPQI